MSLNVQFEKAVRVLVQHLPSSNEASRKSTLFHSIRVGVYLYEHGYSEDIVLAGLLHDTLEWSSVTERLLRSKFGDHIVILVLANTKNDAITDNIKKTDELIMRCVQAGEEALIVKAADILDSFKWYVSQRNTDELGYCMRNANAILKYKPDSFDGPIFDELRVWQEKYTSVTE